MVPKISVVIPAYNAENWIERCIDGVIAQTFTDWELIIIDDGSIDKTSKILDDYLHLISNKYLIKIIKKGNAGVSSARNLGIEEAIGEYIAFVDVDDIIEPTYLENLTKGLRYDLIVTGFCYGETPQMPPINKGQTFCSKKEIASCLDYFLNTDHFCFPWAKLFKMSVLKEYNIRFDTNMRFAEDHVFNWTYLSHINSLYIDMATDYHKMPDELGKCYNLSFDEMEYIDSTLFLLKGQIDSSYNVRTHPANNTFCHVLFLKDYLIAHPCSFYACYFKKYHPHANERDIYDYVANNIFHPGLKLIRQGKYSFRQMNIFLDEPWKLFKNATLKSKYFIPLIKLLR